VGSGTGERIDALVEAGVDIIVIDTAHGHSQGVLEHSARTSLISVPSLTVISLFCGVITFLTKSFKLVSKRTSRPGIQK
jgi:hypothetical protein